MPKPKITLTKRRGNYYVVQIDGKFVGYCERSRNFMAPGGFAGWDFKPSEKSGMRGAWSPKPKLAVEAAIRFTAEQATQDLNAALAMGERVLKAALEKEVT